MRIVVLEHFTSAPPVSFSTDLEAEGRAMRDAIVADFLALPDVELNVLHRPDRPTEARSPRLHAIPVEGEREAVFREVLRSSDAALVIAPESHGLLERLSRIVLEQRRLLLGPSAPTVALAADKLEMARRLNAAGVATPLTAAIPFASAPDRLAERVVPFVIKPRDGCGCQGVSLVRRRDQVEPALAYVRQSTGLDHFLIQDYVAGDDASVSFIAGGSAASGRLLALGLNRQWVRGPGALAYLGGEVPMRHRLWRSAVEAARRAVAALAEVAGDVRGYLGVDLVLGGDDPRVIEINARLTTSYIGLRRVIRESLAGLIRDAVIGRSLPDRVTVEGHCRFGADGKVEGGERSWSTSAGTSAACI